MFGKCDMSCKEKMELFIKLAFLAVFTYGVMSAVCCMKSCSSGQSCCKTASGEVVKPCSASK